MTLHKIGVKFPVLSLSSYEICSYILYNIYRSILKSLLRARTAYTLWKWNWNILLYFPESCRRNCSHAQTRKRTGFYFKLFSHYKIPICIAAVIPPLSAHFHVLNVHFHCP